MSTSSTWNRSPTLTALSPAEAAMPITSGWPITRTSWLAARSAQASGTMGDRWLETGVLMIRRAWTLLRCAVGGTVRAAQETGCQVASSPAAAAAAAVGAAASFGDSRGGSVKPQGSARSGSSGLMSIWVPGTWLVDRM